MKTLDINNVIEEVAYINKSIGAKKKGVNLTTVSAEYNLTSKELTEKLIELGYKRIKGKFVLEDSVKAINETPEIITDNDGGQNGCQGVLPISELSNNESLSAIVPRTEYNVVQAENTEKINSIIDNFDVLMNMIEEYKKTNVIHTCGIVVQLPSEENGDYKTSVRVNKKVMDQFREFCESHREFTQKELLSMALLEYIERHK